MKAEQEGSAFVAIPGIDLAEILCIQEERQVANDNTVAFHSLYLQIPPSPLRAHFVHTLSRCANTLMAATRCFTGSGAWRVTTCGCVPGDGFDNAGMRRGKPPVDLWITQAGYPQLHRRSISSSEVKGMFL